MTLYTEMRSELQQDDRVLVQWTDQLFTHVTWRQLHTRYVAANKSR